MADPGKRIELKTRAAPAKSRNAIGGVEGPGNYTRIMGVMAQKAKKVPSNA